MAPMDAMNSGIGTCQVLASNNSLPDFHSPLCVETSSKICHDVQYKDDLNENVNEHDGYRLRRKHALVAVWAGMGVWSGRDPGLEGSSLWVVYMVHYSHVAR